MIPTAIFMFALVVSIGVGLVTGADPVGETFGDLDFGTGITGLVTGVTKAIGVLFTLPFNLATIDLGDGPVWVQALYTGVTGVAFIQAYLFWALRIVEAIGNLLPFAIAAAVPVLMGGWV